MSGWKNRTRLCISRPTKLTAETGGAGSRSSDKTSPQLSGAGGEELQRLAQRSLVFYVHALLRAVNLAHQPAQHFPRTNLDKSLRALSNQPLHGLAPSNRSCHLAHQSLPRAFWIFDRPGIHVGHHRKLRGRELQFAASQASPCAASLQTPATASGDIPRIAAIEPVPTGTASCMYLPRLRTVRTASAKVIVPAATCAEYSPRLCPATNAGLIPFS